MLAPRVLIQVEQFEKLGFHPPAPPLSFHSLSRDGENRQDRPQRIAEASRDDFAAAFSLRPDTLGNARSPLAYALGFAPMPCAAIRKISLAGISTRRP